MKMHRPAILQGRVGSPGGRGPAIRAALALLLALTLSACASTGSGGGDFFADHLTCPVASYGSPAWTPDGKRIIYSVALSGRLDIHSMTPQGDDDRVLAWDASLPVLSPDGAHLLFSANSPAPHAALLDLASGEVTSLGDLGILPAWSPGPGEAGDGKSIAYRPYNGGGITRLDIKKGRKTVLTTTLPGVLIGDVHPVWSPDGRRIAFTSGRDGTLALYTMDAKTGRNVTRIIRQDDPACPAFGWPVSTAPLAFSPDGTLIAFSKFCGAGQSLRLVTADGRELSGLSYLMDSVAELAWSPGGGRVLVVTQGDSGGTLYTADADGGHLLSVRANGYDGAWSPDGRRIVFGALDAAGLEQIFTANPDGSDTQQITTNPGAGKFCVH